jgi:CBS domain containing-hemolysin-like protein
VTITWSVTLILACLALSGFYSGAETALLSVGRVRVRHRMERGDPSAALVWTMLQAPETLFMAILLAVNVANVTAAAVATRLLTDLEVPAAETVATLVMVPVVLLVAEILPKAAGRAASEAYALSAARILDLTRLVFAPLVALVDASTALLMRLLGVGDRKAEPGVTREEIKGFLESEAAETPGHRKMIRGAWTFARAAVREVMIPLTRVQALPSDATVDQALARGRATGFARFPVYRDRIDDLVGVLHLGELVYREELDPEDPVSLHLRAPLYLPNTLHTEKAILKMQEARETLAVVVDEYGGCDGIVLMKDMFEEVVGDLEGPAGVLGEVTALGPRLFLARGEVDVDFLNEELGLELPKEGYETLAGFLMTAGEGLPRPGARVRTARAVFEVVEVEKRTASRVRIWLV